MVYGCSAMIRLCCTSWSFRYRPRCADSDSDSADDSDALGEAEHRGAAFPRVCAQLHEEDVPPCRVVPELGRGRSRICRHHAGLHRRSGRALACQSER